MERKVAKVQIRKCECANAYMDAQYGKGLRVHNPCVMPKGLVLKAYRCAACGREKEV
jgi:hypothetical protein